jgi:hypothetical protein
MAKYVINILLKHAICMNERQMFACSINRRGLSDDEREKSHIWRHKFISTTYVSHSLHSDATFSTKIAVNPGQIRYSYFLNQECTPNIYDSPQNSWSHTGDNEVTYIMRKLQKQQAPPIARAI